MGLGALGVVGLRFWLPHWMRARPVKPLGEAAAAFASKTLEGLDRARIWDTHVHLVGLGAGNTGCTINPEMRSHWHPIKRFQYDVYASGVGLRNEATADADYFKRLMQLHRETNPLGKLVLLAFDHYVDENGNERPERSPFHTPNEYVLTMSLVHGNLVAGGSVHPYRKDAVARLDKTIDAGAVAIKWLPNAMGIDLDSPLCDPFYRRLAETGVPLITHAGKEYAVHAQGGQDPGNPLRLRRALDAGVHVVVAHCASLGSFPDTDDPSPQRGNLRSFDLFMRLFTDKQYEKNLSADISTLTHIHHSMDPLRELLRAPELHPRLFYGSDYPMPALRIMVSTRRLVAAKLLGADDRTICDEIYESNPLLADLLLNRLLRVEEDGTTYRFSDEVFHTDRLFRRVSPSPSRIFVA